ncbi:MAG: hypothetical protein RJB38_544 [Pseudomonadota bacterium]|jgi:zinc protease
MKTNPSRRITLLTALSLAIMIAKATAANAFDVIVEEDRRLPLAYLNLVIRQGAVSDPKGKTGLTDFMTEMLLRGTRKHTKSQIDVLLDQWGAELAIETRAEAVILRAASLSSKTPELLSLLTEILTEPGFPKVELEKLKKETLSALLAQKGNDQALASTKFTQFLFAGHPYGRPVEGIASEVSSFQSSDLTTHYEQLLQPASFLLLATGDWSAATLQDWATRLESALRKKTEPALVRVSPPTLPSGRRLEIVDKPERTQTQILIGQLGVKMTDQDYYALYLGNAAFGGGSFTSRLMQEIRVKRGWSYGARSQFRFGLQPRSWQVYLFPAEKDTPAALAHTLGMIETLQREGISEQEFTIAKTSSINGAAFLNDTPKKRMENRILEETLNLPRGFFKDLSKNLRSVSRTDVNRALSRFLDPSKLTITVLGTAKNLKSALAEKAGVAEERVVVVPYTAD